MLTSPFSSVTAGGQRCCRQRRRPDQEVGCRDHRAGREGDRRRRRRGQGDDGSGRRPGEQDIGLALPAGEQDGGGPRAAGAGDGREGCRHGAGDARAKGREQDRRRQGRDEVERRGPLPFIPNGVRSGAGVLTGRMSGSGRDDIHLVVLLLRRSSTNHLCR